MDVIFIRNLFMHYCYVIIDENRSSNFNYICRTWRMPRKCKSGFNVNNNKIEMIWSVSPQKQNKTVQKYYIKGNNIIRAQ